MELPARPPADRFTTPGRYRELETQIRHRIEGSDTPILFIYAFDPRTRLGPFVFVDKTLIPGARGRWAPRCMPRASKTFAWCCNSGIPISGPVRHVLMASLQRSSWSPPCRYIVRRLAG